MKKIFLCVLLIFSLVFLQACTSNDRETITYKGESKNWLASYTITKSPKDEYHDVNWQLIYVGNKIPKDSKITYEIISEHLNIKADVKLIEDRINSKSSTYFYDENEIIEINIVIDGVEENISLHH